MLRINSLSLASIFVLVLVVIETLELLGLRLYLRVLLSVLILVPFMCCSRCGVASVLGDPDCVSSWDFAVPGK